MSFIRPNSNTPSFLPPSISAPNNPKTETASGKTTLYFLKKVVPLTDMDSENKVDLEFKEAKTPEKIQKYMSENRDYVLQTGDEDFKFSEGLQTKLEGKIINEIKTKNAKGEVRVLKGSSLRIGTMTGEESRYLSQALERILTQALEKKLQAEQERIEKSFKLGKSSEKEAPLPRSKDKTQENLYTEKRVTIKNQAMREALASQSELEAWAKASRTAREREKENEREFNIRQIVQNSVKAYSQKKERHKEDIRKEEIKNEPHPLSPEVKTLPPEVKKNSQSSP